MSRRSVEIMTCGLLAWYGVWAWGGEPVRVLILTGQNNHAWQETTPELRGILERTGRFSVEVTEQPEAMTAALVSRYDVIVSNWNTWGDGALVKTWPEAARQALMEFVREGKGFVSVHAGSSSFYDWQEYQELAITAWAIGETGHGKQHTFRVAPVGVEHPITRGVEPFLITDELWHKVPMAAGAEILVTAYSDEANGGTGRDEPVLFARPFGAGRSVNLLLGHHARAMGEAGFRVLLARSVEWAATGEVKPEDRMMAWDRSEGSLGLSLNGKLLWQFHYGCDKAKPYFHPLSLAGSEPLTWEAPEDHPWHHGLWFSWKLINGVNFWEEDRATGRSAGLTLWDEPEIEAKEDGSARITMALRYETEPGEVVMRETRQISVSAPDWAGNYQIDWTSAFTAVAPEVKLDRTPIEGEPDGRKGGGYAGLSVRLAEMGDPMVYSENGAVALEEAFLDLDGQGLDYSGVIGGRQCGITMLYGGEGGEKTPWYVIAQPAGAFYYYSPAVLYRAPRTLRTGEEMVLRYRIIVHAGRWDNRRLTEAIEAYRNKLANRLTE